MIDRLDVVAIGVEHKSGIVAGVITPLAGRAVVAAADLHRCRIETLDHGVVTCLEREVEFLRRWLVLLKNSSSA